MCLWCTFPTERGVSNKITFLHVHDLPFPAELVCFSHHCYVCIACCSIMRRYFDWHFGLLNGFTVQKLRKDCPSTSWSSKIFVPSITASHTVAVYPPTGWAADDWHKCWNRAFRSGVTGSTILAGSGRVTGQYDRPGVWPGFCSFCTRFIVAFGERIRDLGICEIAVLN